MSCFLVVVAAVEAEKGAYREAVVEEGGLSIADRGCLPVRDAKMPKEPQRV